MASKLHFDESSQVPGGYSGHHRPYACCSDYWFPGEVPRSAYDWASAPVALRCAGIDGAGRSTAGLRR